MKKRHTPIPAEFPVQPLQPGQQATTPTTCGHCGLSWDDAIVTSWTPAPAARCPFESFHTYAKQKQKQQPAAAPPERTATRQPLHIEGRRYFHRGPGNTYHSVRIFQAGELIAHLPYQYGYGDQFLQTAFDWLGDHGFPELQERHANGSHKHYGTQYLRETMQSTYSVIDVTRRKDL